MSRHLTVSEQILEVMRCTPDCRLDDLVLRCKSFPLQVLLPEVSRLSRVGQLQLTLDSTGFFTLQLLSMNCRPRLVRGLLTRGETMKKENVKSQKGHSDQRSGTARKWDSARVPQPSSVYLTCSEADLEALMLKGEPS